MHYLPVLARVRWGVSSGPEGGGLLSVNNGNIDDTPVALKQRAFLSHDQY
ncbi:hypothetical protein [Magnetospirillum gryphiswaldense]|uniref:Uncharacterized protein n=1 Tax=Magnetospirillum gryphiswaldense TaxID=55518 RepID=Q3BKH6_9PROT|nr:hypothetical protein [Magnetospirillum gryphiswaldense]CAJ30050.1 hypothetical protein mgI392 [Magnetospirillum gryphiswaldense MSR-1]CAM77630.1 conserved hypothetical protein [Magnetospirillum gryphiswaldense MSR-1]CAM77955.1 hypothetical protein MGR_4023 [Magnetospirillum gryphiswaldense MSR-1]